MKVAVIALALSLIVYGQEEYPQIMIGSRMIRNNSVVNVNQLGEPIQCITDINTCCTEQDGLSGRVWCLPNGTKLSRDGVQEVNSFIVNATTRRLDLQLTDLGEASSNPALSGIYGCLIDTSKGSLESVYVGLYNEPGSEPIAIEEDNVTFLGPSRPPSSFQCTTINRPATTVQWFLDDVELENVETVTVLNDARTARYTHTLTLDTIDKGVYKCYVTTHNDHIVTPTRMDDASILIHNVGLPEDVEAYQETTTSVSVYWTPPKYDAIGYVVYYYTGATSGNITVEDRESRNVFVTGLVNGEIYLFTVAGLSEQNVESEEIPAYQNPVSLIPGAPMITLVSTTKDSITIHWTVPTGTVVNRYDLEWIIIEGALTTSGSGMASDTTNSYTIPDLEDLDDATIYITVTSVNDLVGSDSSVPFSIHSSLLQDTSSDDSTTIDTGAIIGGAVGIVIISVVIGMIAAFVVCAVIQRKKESSVPNIYQRSNGTISSDPPTNANMAYNEPVIMTSQNMAYRSDNNTVTYDYITDPPHRP